MSNNFDCYVINLDVEYLPGVKHCVPMSALFTDLEVAHFSLHHVRGHHPGVFLKGYTDPNGRYDIAYQEMLIDVRKRDEFYRKRYLINY